MDKDSREIHRHYYYDQYKQFLDTDTSIYSLQIIDDFGIPLDGVPILLNHEAYVTTPNGEVFIASDEIKHLDITFPQESDYLLDLTIILQRHKIIQAKRKAKVRVECTEFHKSSQNSAHLTYITPIFSFGLTLNYNWIRCPRTFSYGHQIVVRSKEKCRRKGLRNFI